MLRRPPTHHHPRRLEYFVGCLATVVAHNLARWIHRLFRVKCWLFTTIIAIRAETNHPTCNEQHQQERPQEPEIIIRTWSIV